mgnify:CR=1 FL=1
MRRDRWAYMADPRYNPPCDACPDCTSPSKVHFIGGRTEDGAAVYRWRCEHGHEWLVRETRTVQGEGSGA